MARTQGSHSETTGPRIRAAAETLFARHGYAAVSMRQIAGAVGLQAGALYNYTPDKQSLLVDLMQRHMEALLSAWGQEARGETAMSALEAFARFHIRFNLARRDAVFIAYNELRSLEPEGFAQIEALRNAYEGELAGVLIEGRAAGLFQLEDPRVTTRAVIALLNGVLTWYRDDGRLSLEEVEDLHWHMVRRLVGV